MSQYSLEDHNNHVALEVASTLEKALKEIKESFSKYGRVTMRFPDFSVNEVIYTRKDINELRRTEK